MVDALPNVTVNRISGPNRYETAVEIANTVGAGAIGQFLGKRTVILASGTSFADALAAGPISYRGVVGGTAAGPHPILLTTADALPPVTDAALTSLGVTQVVIAGGTAVVSDAVATAIEAKGITVIRVAGANRYATAAALGTVAVTPAGSGGFGFDGVNVGLANGTPAFGGFDALAAAPYLGKNAAPLLGTADSLPAESAAFLTANNKTITTLHVFGGTTAVSAETVIEAEVAATQAVPTATITATQAQTSVKVVISEPVLVSTAVTSTAFALNNTNINVANVAAVSPTGTPPVATEFTVTVPALQVGDSFRLNANEIKNAAGTAVASQTVVVTADTTKPVATVLAAPNPALSSFQVSFNESVSVGATAPASYSAIGTTANNTSSGIVLSVTGPIGINAAGTLTTVTVSRPLLPGDRVGINGGVIGDLVPAPDTNFADATSKTVLADTIAPSLTGATVKIDDSAQAAAVISAGGGNPTAVTYTAKAAVPGVSGNSIRIQYVDDNLTNTTEVVKVIDNADLSKTIQVDVRTGGSTSVQVAAAITADIFSNALVTAVAVLPTPTAFVGLVGATPATAPALSGGVTNITVVATYSEVVIAGGWNIHLGNAATTAVICAAPAITPTNGTSATYTATCNSVPARPTAAAQLVNLAGGSDLAGNTLPATAVTLTAAS